MAIPALVGLTLQVNDLASYEILLFIFILVIIPGCRLCTYSLFAWMFNKLPFVIRDTSWNLAKSHWPSSEKEWTGTGQINISSMTSYVKFRSSDRTTNLIQCKCSDDFSSSQNQNMTMDDPGLPVGEFLNYCSLWDVVVISNVSISNTFWDRNLKYSSKH